MAVDNFHYTWLILIEEKDLNLILRRSMFFLVSAMPLWCLVRLLVGWLSGRDRYFMVCGLDFRKMVRHRGN